MALGFNFMIVAELRYCVASVTAIDGVQRQPSKSYVSSSESLRQPGLPEPVSVTSLQWKILVTMVNRLSLTSSFITLANRGTQKVRTCVIF